MTPLSPSFDIIYLACPYTDPNKDLREQRFHAATEAAAALIKRGHIVFSPITMTHPIDVVLGKGVGTLGSDFWVTFDEAFMDKCSEMVILQIDGWQRSRGIAREIEFFIRQQKPISFMTDKYEIIPQSAEALRQLVTAAG